MNIRAVKVEAAALAEESSGVLAAMFLVFGTFTIVAGILLVLTIVIMLAESRRSELGTMRALGVTQSDVRALAVQEGITFSISQYDWSGRWTDTGLVHQHRI